MYFRGSLLMALFVCYCEMVRSLDSGVVNTGSQGGRSIAVATSQELLSVKRAGVHYNGTGVPVNPVVWLAGTGIGAS